LLRLLERANTTGLILVLYLTIHATSRNTPSQTPLTLIGG
jgi:hypothetical protein